MKKVLGVLAALLLMASPALANVTMTIVDAGSGWAEISYNAAGEPNLPRAFALRIDVDAGSMDAVQFKAGTANEACATCEDFKIHPGNIQIDGAGNVVSWGRPVAPGNAPDNPPQLPSTTYIIIEMGSLYKKGTDPAPPVSGLLLRVHVTETCTMEVSEEATVRGGVVLEDPDVIFTFVGDIETIEVPPDFPLCWLNDTQCEGDIAYSGPDVALNTSDFFPFRDAYGKTYFADEYWYPGVDPPPGAGKYNPCADLSRDGRINTTDFFEFRDRYMGTIPAPPGNCNTAGDETWPPEP